MTRIESAVYSVSEAATRANCDKKLIYAEIAAGRIPAVRLGRKIVIPRRMFDRLLMADTADEQAP
jgi:excisionase family DNA binding protein